MCVCVCVCIEVSTAATAPSSLKGHTLLHLLARRTRVQYSALEYDELKAFNGFRPKNTYVRICFCPVDIY